jgi:hypothetical protein
MKNPAVVPRDSQRGFSLIRYQRAKRNACAFIRMALATQWRSPVHRNSGHDTGRDLRVSSYRFSSRSPPLCGSSHYSNYYPCLLDHLLSQ